MNKLASWTRKLSKAGSQLLFPPVCAFCEAEISGDDPIELCAACRENFTQAVGPCCSRCGGLRVSSKPTGTRCASCRRYRFRFANVAYLGAYDHSLRLAVLRMKHPRDQALAMALGELSVQRLSDRVETWRPDLVAPIPMHWRRRLTRQINNPELLSEAWSRRLRIPFARNLLIRRRNTTPQADLPEPERFKNVRNAFRLARNYRLRGAKILLVDDILTTGATCHEAAGALKEQGAEQVSVVVLARTLL